MDIMMTVRRRTMYRNVIVKNSLGYGIATLNLRYKYSESRLIDMCGGVFFNTYEKALLAAKRRSNDNKLAVGDY